MKKTIFLFAILLACMSIRAQTYTIADGKNHIEIQYPTGDTAFMGTGLYAGTMLYMVNGDEIFVMTGQRWSPGRITNIPSYKPSNFGYSSGRDLANVLVPRYFKELNETYSYTDGNMDTVSYKVGSTVIYQEVYGYSGGVGTSKSIVNTQ